MPDSSFIDKMEDYIHQGSSIFIRGNFISKVNEFRRKVIAVFTSNKDVIIKANKLLKDSALQSVSFKGLTLSKSDFEISNSLDNESWDDQVTDEMDKIEKFLSNTGERLTALSDSLEALIKK